MTNSGMILSLPMGLFVKATVATGASAKNILILLASSGIVEKAIKAIKAQKIYILGQEIRQSIFHICFFLTSAV